MDSVLLKSSGETDTEEKPHEDGGRDRREAATSPGLPGTPRSWRRQEGPSPGASAGSTGDVGGLHPKMLPQSRASIDTHNGISGIRKSEMMAFAATRLDLESLIVSDGRYRKTNTIGDDLYLDLKTWHK